MDEENNKKMDMIYPRGAVINNRQETLSILDLPSTLTESAIYKNQLAMFLVFLVLVGGLLSGIPYAVVILFCFWITRLFFITKNRAMGPVTGRGDSQGFIIVKRDRFYVFLITCFIAGLIYLAVSDNTPNPEKTSDINGLLLLASAPFGILFGYWHSYVNLQNMRVKIKNYGTKVT